MADEVTVQPGVAAGTVRAPPSKSVTHRAFLLAAQSSDGCLVRAPLLAGDTLATLRCLEQIGARCSLEGADVRFSPASLRPSAGVLDCGNSGTTMRFLAATTARFPVACTLTGDASLRQRPMAALLSALANLGVACRSRDARAPLTVQGPLRPGAAVVDGAMGSQSASALLLSLPFLPGASTVVVPPPAVSKPYLDVTCDVAAQAGLDLGRDAAQGLRFEVPGGQRVTARQLHVEGDWSAAAFPLTAAAVTGAKVDVTGLNPASCQGDRAIVDSLRAFGCTVGADAERVTCSSGPLHGAGTIDVSQTPDLFPILAILAAASRGTTRLVGGAHLRGKETDRIAAMREGLTRMGISVTETPDGLDVVGGTLRGAAVDAHGDHRVHMAFVVAALEAGTSTVTGVASAATSYPDFHRAMAGLGAKLALAKMVSQ